MQHSYSKYRQGVHQPPQLRRRGRTVLAHLRRQRTHCTSMPPPRMPMVGGSSAICWLGGNGTAQLAKSQFSPAAGCQ